MLARLGSLRQHQRRGERSPHKPLLVLLALGRLAATGSSQLPWSQAEAELADLIAEFGPPPRTGRAQSAAYPFTRLRADGVWVLDQDVQMDLVGPLAREHVTGRGLRGGGAAGQARVDPDGRPGSGAAGEYAGSFWSGGEGGGYRSEPEDGYSSEPFLGDP